MKVYLHYDLDGEEKSMTVKLTLPKSWRTGPVEQLVEVMIQSYNKKHQDNLLDYDAFHFETKDDIVLPMDATVELFVSDKQDLFLRPGEGKTMLELGVDVPKQKTDDQQPAEQKSAAPKIPPGTSCGGKSRTATDTAKKEADPNLLVCKHFGCNKRYKEEENHDKHCRYHSKPPVFHETRKWWACCPKKIAYDWETFTAIPGCCVGRCTNEDPNKKFLGGSDVRAAQQYEYAPQRIDQNQEQKPAATDGLSKLMQLRKALIAFGVNGTKFDQARDHFKSKHEDLGAKVWDKVVEELVGQFTTTLEHINSE